MAIRGTSVILVLAMLLAGASASRELEGIDFSAGGSCTAVGVSSQYGYVEDLWGKACAGAVEHACSIDGSYDGKKFVDEMEDFFHGYATATVDVWAKALAKCTSYGKYTTGCAYAYANAHKEVQARIQVLASAFAQAWNKCKRCDPTADASMFTQLIVKISAEAKVRAQASVCVSGNDSAFQRSVSECWASVIAKACAHAVAKAVVKGGCAGQAAKASVLAYVHVHVNDPTCECTYWKNNGHGTVVWTNPPASVGSCKFHAWAP